MKLWCVPEPFVPPVPIKTYQWEDVRRDRLVGAYPWTHLNKGPYNDDESQATRYDQLMQIFAVLQSLFVYFLFSKSYFLSEYTYYFFLTFLVFNYLQVVKSKNCDLINFKVED